MRNDFWNVPRYPDDSDYTTNSPSYYDDLARKNKLMEILAKKIYNYDKELAKRFIEWDKNLQEFPEDVKNLLNEWMDTGLLEDIINENILNQKLDTSIYEQFKLSTNQQLAEKVNYSDRQENQVVKGLDPTVNGSLNVQLTDGKAYIGGKVLIVPAYPKVFTPNTDTYVDLTPTGTYIFKEVANGVVPPIVDGGNLRVTKVISNDTQVTQTQPQESNTFFGVGSGKDNTSGWKNVFMGYFAGRSNTTGSYNTILGYFAGHLNTEGTHNTFLGYGSGRGNKKGQFNTFVGFESGHLNTEGKSNVGVGNHALEGNLTGEGNTAVGRESAYRTIGNFNTMIGYGSGKANTTGNNNVFVGTQSGSTGSTSSDNVYVGYQSGLLSTGTWNTALGSQSLIGNTSGYLNTVFGFKSGGKIATGNSNTFIGAESGNGVSQSPIVTNSTAIGSGANTTRNNSVRLGNDIVSVVETMGDYESLGNGKGMILKSPNGTRFRITVSDAKELVVTNY